MTPAASAKVAPSDRLLESIPGRSPMGATIPRAHAHSRSRAFTVGGMLLFWALFLAGTAFRATVRPLWHDELFSLYLSQLPTSRALWAALSSGIDLNPPGYYLLVRAVALLIPSPELAVRVPSLLGFAASCLFLYAFMRHRHSRTTSLIAMAFPFATTAAAYAYEGRAYGVVMGCAAAALLCWQRAADRTARRRRWLAGLAAALAVAVCCHYYAVLLFIPLIAGELHRARINRRIDWGVALALCVAILPLAAFGGLIAKAREFAPTFWSRPDWFDVLEFYGMLLASTGAPLIAAVVVAAGVVTWLRKAAPRPFGDSHSSTPEHEWAAMIVFALLPLVLYLGALLTGAYVHRYALPAVIGISGLAASLLAAFVRDRRVLIAVACVFVAWGSARNAAALRFATASRADIPASILAYSKTAPIFVADVRVYLPLQHYAPPAARRQIFYVLKPSDVQGARGDTGSRALNLLGNYISLQIVPVESLIDGHAQFALYGPSDWAAAYLQRQGVTLRYLHGADADLFLEAAW